MVSLSLLSFLFAELSLTPTNLSTVLESMDDSLWGVFSHYINIPFSKQLKIRSQYSSDKECKQAAIIYFISSHPAPSWKLVAHALYQMRDDSSLRALHRLQQLFPTGTGKFAILQKVFAVCHFFAESYYFITKPIPPA